ncbi:MAG: ComEC/Rec2 family competence protein [Spirochaetales bacterium]|nr:ComEC/Rec2 family competence protein [Spirochaetales bacterium]
MIIRNISFFVIFSLALVFTLYVADIRGISMFLVCLAVISAGSGVTFLAPDFTIKLKQRGFLFIAFAIGVSFGFSLSARMHLQTMKVFTGIELTKVTSFTGVCIKDSVPGAKNGFIHYLELTSVSSSILDASANARGIVMVLSENGRPFHTGEMITVNRSCTPADFRPDINFICRAKEHEMRQTGYSWCVFRARKDILLGLMAIIKKMGFPASTLFEALFLGKRENLPAPLYQGFEQTGTLHILALSGLHVGIIYSFLSILLFLLPGKWLKYMAGSIVVLFYLFLVGPRPSLLRASVMLMIFGLGFLLSLEREPLNLLAISAFIILMIDPFSAFSLSFQLSFLALAGIFIMGRPIAALIRPYLPSFVALPLAFSFGAQIMTAPIALASFGIIYPAGIIVTLLLLPVITVFLIGGIIFLFLFALPVPFLQELGRLFFSFLYRVIFIVTSAFKSIPGISFEWKWWYILFFLIVLFPFLFTIRFIKNKINKRLATSL